jgi:alpha-amylase/alpha-mannosidase (GH57 family)
VSALRSIVIHGHFYQPPRENPWLDAVEVQDSAAPFHDWNERVTAECYAPNTAARRVDGANRVLDIVDNFERISFNVGPTLLVWLARHRTDVYDRILAADRASVGARGRGNAVAQVYNHMILPLASYRDKVTQVAWGLADFRTRFGREAEGMWLPETAADTETLSALADAGVGFTILAPHQAHRVRPLETAAWAEPPAAGIDPSRAYLWRGPAGQRLAVFFYDGPVSRAIAFEDALERAENLVGRLMGAFSDARDWPQLVSAATDGESYGHHHRFGEMALAEALHRIERDASTALTNYAAFLAAQPPTHEVEIREATSWSCPHGVERWRADCGCRLRGDWHQRWRAPLREALDWLRDTADTFYEGRAASLLKDPWGARDAYVEVLLDPGRWAAWAALHGRDGLDDAARVEMRRLLELQRNRMLMYTSCGWFFDELSGLEPVQILKYAAMVVQLMRDLGGDDLEPDMIRRLAAAPSNVADYGDGSEVWRRLVRPSVIDLRRVIAHYAMTGLVETYPDDARVYATGLGPPAVARAATGGATARVGHVRVTSELTGETRESVFAAVHFGGHDVTCGIRPFEDRGRYDSLKADLLERFGRHSVADMVRGLDEHFSRDLFAVTDLFLEERRRLLDRVTQAALEKQEQVLQRVWQESRDLVWYLRSVDAPIPEILRLTARYVLERRIVATLVAIEGDGLPQEVFELAAEARRLGLTLDLSAARPAMREIVRRALARVAEEPTPERVAPAVALVEGARQLGVPFGLWATQTAFFDLWRARPDAHALLAVLAVRLGFALDGAGPQ